MPIQTLETTVKLSPYYHAHKQELTFGKDETPPSQQTTIETRKLNWFSRFVEKIDDSKGIALFFRGLFALTLAFSLVGIPVLVLWVRERNLSENDEKIKEIALAKLNLQNEVWNKRAEIVENLKFDNFTNTPLLDLKGRNGATGYLDFLKPDELDAPVMKGLDKAGRAFLAIKMIDKNNDHTFVMTLFQRYKNQSDWTWIGEGGLNNPLQNLITAPYIGPKEERIFNEIIHGKHPQFTLA